MDISKLIEDGFGGIVATLIIAIANQKGGASKTTLTICLAVCGFMAGYRVAIIDLDPQMSASSWGKRRAGEPPVVFSCGPADLEATVTKLRAANFDLVFIDTAGAAGKAEKNAIAFSDLVLVPSAPSILDLEATLPTARMISGSGKPFYYVVTQCPPGERRISEAEALLNRVGGRAGEPLHFRVDYQEAMTRGLGVTEYRRNGAAASEILTLWKWVSDRLGLDDREAEHDEAE